MADKLPKENQVLIIVNCARTWQEVEREGVYICPGKGGAYRHRPSRYFGVYHDKKVSYIANIEAVVDVNPDHTTSFRWIAGLGQEDMYRQKAVEFAIRLRPKSDFPVQVFLLGVLQATNFKKDSPGGMLGSVQYRDASVLDVNNAGYVAMKLNGKKWSELDTATFKVRQAQGEDTNYQGKYLPFQNWLATNGQGKDQLQLTFEKIEDILICPLPPSAREYPAWWLDKSPDTTHSHAFSWLDVGWQVQTVDLNNQWVTFQFVDSNRTKPAN